MRKIVKIWGIQKWGLGQALGSDFNALDSPISHYLRVLQLPLNLSKLTFNAWKCSPWLSSSGVR